MLPGLFFISNLESSLAAVLVSSAMIKSADFKTSISLKLASLRLPIGVAQIYKMLILILIPVIKNKAGA
jgi:hypothetical protein